MIQQAQIPSDLCERKKGLHFYILTVFYTIREVEAQGTYLDEIKQHVPEDAAKLLAWGYNASVKSPMKKT